MPQAPELSRAQPASRAAVWRIVAPLSARTLADFAKFPVFAWPAHYLFASGNEGQRGGHGSITIASLVASVVSRSSLMNARHKRNVIHHLKRDIPSDIHLVT